MNIYVDPIIRTAILSEVTAVRHERELARAAAATALTNDRGGYWRHRADAYNRTLRSLVRVLGDIREGTARLAAEELDAAKTELRLDKLRADWQEDAEQPDDDEQDRVVQWAQEPGIRQMLMEDATLAEDEYADWTVGELVEAFGK